MIDTHEPIDVPEMLEMKGAPLTAARIAMSYRQRAHELQAEACRLLADAAELEFLARVQHRGARIG